MAGGAAHYKSWPLRPSPPDRQSRTPCWVSSLRSSASSVEIILTTAPVFFHDPSFIYILRNNSRTQVQSEKIVISSLRVNDREEPCSVTHNTRVYRKHSIHTFPKFINFPFRDSDSSTNPIRSTSFSFLTLSYSSQGSPALAAFRHH
jgi:hypothetical protein